MTVLTIAATDLRRLLRDRVNLFFVFALPLVLILVLGSIFGSFEPRLGLVVDDEGPLAADLADAIAAIDSADVSRPADLDEALESLRRDELEAAVIVPADYDERLRRGEVVVVDYVAVPDSGGFEVRSLVDAVVADQAGRLRAARVSEAEGLTDLDGGLAAADRAAGLVETTTINVVAPDLEPYSVGSSQGVVAAQQLVLFVFITSLAASAALIQTRRLGIATRMLASPTTVPQILVGFAAGRFLVAAVQGVFILVAAAVLFGVDWGDWPASLALLSAFSLVGTGAAMLMGAVFSNDAQAGPIGIFVALAFGALGGSMVPLELFSDTLLTVAHLTPHAWANDGFSEIIRRGGGLGDITIELAVLTAYGLALLGAASLLLRHTLRHP